MMEVLRKLKSSSSPDLVEMVAREASVKGKFCRAEETHEKVSETVTDCPPWPSEASSVACPGSSAFPRALE